MTNGNHEPIRELPDLNPYRRREYFLLFYAIYSGRECSMREAWLALEEMMFARTGCNRYTSFESFKVNLYRVIKENKI